MSSSVQASSMVWKSYCSFWYTHSITSRSMTNTKALTGTCESSSCASGSLTSSTIHQRRFSVPSTWESVPGSPNPWADKAATRTYFRIIHISLQTTNICLSFISSSSCRGTFYRCLSWSYSEERPNRNSTSGCCTISLPSPWSSSLASTISGSEEDWLWSFTILRTLHSSIAESYRKSKWNRK